jgi:hypothetical protein
MHRHTSVCLNKKCYFGCNFILFRNYLQSESIDKKKQPFNLDNWQFECQKVWILVSNDIMLFYRKYRVKRTAVIAVCLHASLPNMYRVMLNSISIRQVSFYLIVFITQLTLFYDYLLKRIYSNCCL